ncbi:MAG: hypothetical protein Q8K92_06590 [Leadbetterella sp.]|nr:hypothetical protein [Leadbetterella sp.]
MITLRSKQGQTNLEFSTLVNMFQSQEFETLKKTYENLKNNEEKKKFRDENIPKYSPSLYFTEEKSFFNNLIAFKIENLNEDVLHKIKEDKFIFCTYYSFTGKRRILLFKVNQIPKSGFENAKNQIISYLRDELNIEASKINEFVNITYDNEIYLNQNCSVFEPDAEWPIDEKLNDNYDILKRLNKTKKQIDKISKSNIKFGEPILYRINEKVIFPNSITVIQGKSGVHKSRLVQHLCSTFINDKSDNIIADSLLGFRATKSVLVVYIDTERSIKEQFPAAIQDIKVNANFKIEDEVENLDFYSMIEFKRNSRIKAIRALIMQVKAQNTGHTLAVIDVATDIISDFNSVDESMAFIDFLNECINEFDISFIVLIHENPGLQTVKARGHLGTELMNKATTHLSIKEENDINGINFFKVSYLKCRNSKKYPPYFIKFDETARILKEVSDSELIELKNARNKKADNNDIAEHIAEIFEENILQSVLVDSIKSEFDIKDRTAQQRLRDIEEIPIPIIGADGNKYRLIRAGKPVTYRLELIIDPIEK